MITSVLGFFIQHLFEIISTAILGYIAYLTLTFTAKPKIRIYYEGDTKTNRLRLITNTQVCLNFRLKNIGHWHSKPAATNVTLSLNFDPQFNLTLAKYGANLENQTNHVSIGKNLMKNFCVGGIILTAREPEEYVQVELVTPKYEGTYKTIIAALSDEGDLGVHPFYINVIQNK
jgi:hypothetical protein